MRANGRTLSSMIETIYEMTSVYDGNNNDYALCKRFTIRRKSGENTG